MTLRDELRLYLSDANNKKLEPGSKITQEQVDTVRYILKDVLLMIDRHQGETL